MGVRLLIVRPWPGAAGETQRLTHLVDCPDGGAAPVRLRARCGASFGRDELELLATVGGMPCESCLRHIPPPPEDPDHDLVDP